MTGNLPDSSRFGKSHAEAATKRRLLFRVTTNGNSNGKAKTNTQWSVRSMRLNTEFRSYAQTLYHQRHSELVVSRENKLRSILIEAGDVDWRVNHITNAIYESHRELLCARVDSYLAAYRVSGLMLDKGDEQEILDELRNLNSTELDYGLRSKGLEDQWQPNADRAIPNVPQHLMDRFEMALNQACAKLRSGSLEISHDYNHNRADQQPTNTLMINGDNHGPIQQGGSGNIQTS